MSISAFWQEFLALKGLDKNTRYYECFHFELTKQAANELLALVLNGKKRATSVVCRPLS